MMDIAAVVKKYLALTGGFDLPLHLSQLGLTKLEIEHLFSAWDEDYQISRFMLLARSADEELGAFPEAMRTFHINDYEYTHVTFRKDVQQLLKPA